MDTDTHTHTHTHGRTMMGRHKEKVATYKPRRKAEADPSFTALRRNQPCQHLDFGLPVSGTVRQYVSFV